MTTNQRTDRHPAAAGPTALALLLLMAALAGCSAVLGGQVSGSEDGGIPLSLSMSSQDEGVLQGLVNGIATASSGHSRTIAPSYDLANTLNLYLTGTSHLDGSAIGPLPIDRQTLTWQQANLHGSVRLDAGMVLASWSLTLWAAAGTVQSLADLEARAVLRGDTHVDLTNTRSCHFNLGTRGLSAAGTIDVTVAAAAGFPTAGFAAGQGGSSLGILLTDHTGTVVQTTGGNAVQISSANFFVTGGTNPATVTGPASMNVSQIPAGTYNLEVRLRLQAGGPLYLYSEPIVIAPNMTTAQAVLVPDILGSVAAPAGLTAAYRTGSEDKESGTYRARFQWQDNANNELGFELQLARLDSGMAVAALPASDAEWDALVALGTLTSYGEDVFEKAEYLGGSTMPNATEVELRLRLGERYLARIRSLGDGTQSSWAYLTLPAPTGADYRQFTGATVSRFYISYNLQGGLYDSDGTGPAASTTGELVQFYCHENGNGIPILAPLGGGRDTQPYLLLNGVEPWGGWLQGDLSEYPGEQAPYSYAFPKNLVLIAKYGSSYPLNAAWLKVNNRSVNPYPGAAINIPRRENNYNLNFVLTLPQDAHGITGFTYDAVTVMFSWPDTHGPLFVFETNTAMVPGQPLTITVPTSGMSNGEYFMKIECRKGNSVSSLVAKINMT